MSRLIEFGIVYSSKEGKFVKYYIRGDIADLVTLLKSYHPLIWEKLSDRLSELFLGITYATTSEIRGEYSREDTNSTTTTTSSNTNINKKQDENGGEQEDIGID